MTVEAGAGGAEVAAGFAAVVAATAAVGAPPLAEAAALVGADAGAGLLHAATRKPMLVPAPSWMNTRLLTVPVAFCMPPNVAQAAGRGNTELA